MLFFTIFIFWLIYFLTLYGVWWILEKHYPKAFSCFDFKPFKCRKCLTTWSLIAIYISVGLLFNNYIFIASGIIITIITGIALYIDDKEKFS